MFGVSKGMRPVKLSLQIKMMSSNNVMAPSTQQPLNGQGVLRITGDSSARSGRSASADARGDGGVVKVCTVNVGSLRGRSREVVEMLARREVDICCLQEVRYRNQGSMAIGSNEEKYKLWYSGNEEGTNGVGILVRFDMAEKVIEVERLDDRVMKIKIVLGKVVFHVFSVYAPQVGRAADEKAIFWERLEDQVAAVPPTEGIIIGGDLNAHIGRERDGFEEILGCNGFGVRNNEGEAVLELCKNHCLRILNSYFKKDVEKLITYKSGGAETQIDFILMKSMTGIGIEDCTVIPGEACLTQHRMVRAKITVSGMRRQKRKGRRIVKTWRLKNDQLRDEFEAKVAERAEQSGGSWRELQDNLLKSGEEVCGLTSGKRGKERETWWWNVEVQEAIKEKRRTFKNWQRTRSEFDRNIYVAKKIEAKRQVAASQKRAWEEWSTDLNTSEGKNKMFKIAKQMKKDHKDVQGSNFIKDETGAIKIEDTGVQDRWRRYFSVLLNDENENDIEEVSMVEGPIEDITEDEVERAVKGMKNGKASGPSGVTADMFKGAGKTGVTELQRVFRRVVADEESPIEWRNSLTLPLYKGKGDALECSNYRGLRLLEHGMKVWEKVLYERLKQIVNIADCQFGFMGGKSTIDAIFITRLLQEKYTEKKKELYHVFVDLEKAFDKVPRHAIVWALRRQGVPERLVRLVMALYEGSKSRVCVAGGTSEDFEIGVGVHQGSALSPLLFIVVMEEATREGRQGDPWELLYADDLVLTAESMGEVEAKFRDWKQKMERRGLKVNIGKTKLMVTGRENMERVQSGRFPCGVCGRGVGANSILCVVCDKWCHKKCSRLRNLNRVVDFRCPACVRREGVAEVEVEENIIVGEQLVGSVKQFCYLGDVLDCEGGVERAVRMRVAAAWSKWREIARLLTNRHIPLRNRAGVYTACIRPVMLYGAEAWGLTQRLEDVLIKCDRRMLRRMAGITWRDDISSVEVARRCRVKQLDVVLREKRLRWFGHVVRREGTGPLGRVMELDVGGRRPVGRPRKTWQKCVNKDLEVLGVGVDDALDRANWKQIIERLTLRDNLT